MNDALKDNLKLIKESIEKIPFLLIIVLSVLVFLPLYGIMSNKIKNMSVILEIHRRLDSGMTRREMHRFKNTTPNFESTIYEDALWMRLAHLPRAANRRIIPERLVRSHLFNEYTLSVDVEVLSGRVNVWDAYDDQEANGPLVVFTNSQLASFQSSTDHKPGVEFTVFEESGRESYARLVEERARRDPPVRFGVFTFRRHELRDQVRRK